MKLIIEGSAIVITPSIGTKHLIKAVDSVLKQTYGNIKHLIVADGQKYETAIRGQINLHFQGDENLDRIIITSTPFNTGGGGWNGQKIYSAYPHLLTQDYILFLDEDNWFEPNHVRSLINLIEQKNLDWAYSLRNIYTKDKEFVAEDKCESLGRWPIYWSIGREEQYIIDTSAYCYKNSFITNTCHMWHNGVWGEDRRYYHAISKIMKHDNYATTGQHTLNYRLDDNIERKYGNINFFSEGNEIVKKHYGEYPWLKT